MIKILPVIYRDRGFMNQPFAFGGEDGPAVGDEKSGIAPGTPFEELPEDWHCPRCRRPKSAFNPA